MKGAFEACYSVTFPASTCFQSHGSLWVLGRKPSTSSPRRPKIVHITPALQSQNCPGRKQGLHLTDEEVKAQRGTGTCPRSSSKVKGYPEYFRKERAQLPPGERMRIADAPWKGPGGGSISSRKPFLSSPGVREGGREGRSSGMASCRPGFQSSPPPPFRSSPAQGQQASPAGLLKGAL